MGTFTLKYPYLKRISWPLFKEAFLRVFEIGWSWMQIRAWICWQGILLQNQFSLFLCILKPEAYAQKLDRSKTPAQLHIMKWNPDAFGSIGSVYLLSVRSVRFDRLWRFHGESFRLGSQRLGSTRFGSYIYIYIWKRKTWDVKTRVPQWHGFVWKPGKSKYFSYLVANYPRLMGSAREL